MLQPVPSPTREMRNLSVRIDNNMLQLRTYKTLNKTPYIYFVITYYHHYIITSITCNICVEYVLWYIF